MTPNELAAELGISSKTLRAFLRREYGKLSTRFDTRWDMTALQIETVRSHFARGRASTVSFSSDEPGPANFGQPSETVAPNASGDAWAQILTAPRFRSELLRTSDVPDSPGLYAWFRGEECVYLGISGDLRGRLSTHRGTSRDLSRSTFRSWVAVHIHGLERAQTRERPSVMTTAQIAAVNQWIAESDVTWVTQPSRGQAALLESILLKASRPLLNAI